MRDFRISLWLIASGSVPYDASVSTQVIGANCDVEGVAVCNRSGCSCL